MPFGMYHNSPMWDPWGTRQQGFRRAASPFQQNFDNFFGGFPSHFVKRQPCGYQPEEFESQPRRQDQQTYQQQEDDNDAAYHPQFLSQPRDPRRRFASQPPRSRMGEEEEMTIPRSTQNRLFRQPQDPSDEGRRRPRIRVISGQKPPQAGRNEEVPIITVSRSDPIPLDSVEIPVINPMAPDNHSEPVSRSEPVNPPEPVSKEEISVERQPDMSSKSEKTSESAAEDTSEQTAEDITEQATEECVDTETSTAEDEQAIAKAYSQIAAVRAEVDDYCRQISNFGDTKQSKLYRFLEEMLERCLLKLDDINTNGNPDVRASRKQTVLYIDKCLAELDSRVVPK